MKPAPEIDVAASAEELAARAAAWIAAKIAAAPKRIALNLSGGSTPKEVFRLLAAEPLRSAIDWSKVEIFWGDERFVPLDHAMSNFRMTSETLLSHVPVPPGQIHPVPVDAASPEKAAALYDGTLREFYGAPTLDLARPLFDVTLLGLGADGHTASLFPGTPALEIRDALVSAVVGATPEPRITMTYPALASSAEIAFLVSGEAKREILRRVLANDAALPASRIETAGALRIFADRAAFGG
ncbi:6-phosphogluconolactonase [Methylocella silvestris BL2]|uniref:6-phosphogluconolactonase n=1 Tax=Methylocella silvestris (strain DSM 15510 / CIP 108128 / LMG 27833 / NCIMB 13906 / BL2) TaxID=395965 RepID=B8ELV8_METSB|nr:6-phosphogluconolactonase [Methylocella silvestris]ACK50739.1 6-phosphogluconolactonase [Methylocella silvestris BL2]